MATYLLFGKYSSEALKGISAQRSEEAKALFKKHGGELKQAYATLGGVDLVMIADLPDNARRYIARLEQVSGVPAAIVSTGSDRDDTILRNSELGIWN